MVEKGGVILKVKHSADSYNEDKKSGRTFAKKQIEIEENAARAIINLKHRRECSGEVTKFSWCSDQLCRMWYDMSQYFGFLGEDIIDTDIDNAIVSVADGGSGIYERLIVLGHRILDASGKEYAVKKYMEFGIEGLPKNLNKMLESNRKLLVFLKMRWFSASVCSTSCLANFASKYSHYCKAELNSENSNYDENKLAKYVKFCISFCIYGQGMIDWNNPLNVDDKICKRFPWLEVIIRSMDLNIISPPIRENDKFLTNEEVTNIRTLDILWKYFGYSRNKKSVPPRVVFALNTVGDAHLPEERTGQMIFSHYVSHYFKTVASEHGFSGVDLLHWVEREKNTLLESNSVELFSLIYLELGLIYSNGSSNADEKLSRYRSLFFSLIANMFVLSEEDSSAKLWLQELVTCVRQIQLYIMEYQEFTRSQAQGRTNLIPDNEVTAVSEQCLDYTHTPEIFIELEQEEIRSLIQVLENFNTPDVVEMVQRLVNSSKYCISSVMDIAKIPRRVLEGVFRKIAKYVKAKNPVGKCKDSLLDIDSDSDSDSGPDSRSGSELDAESSGVYDKKGDLRGGRKGVRKRDPCVNNIYCAEALSPILRPVALRFEENKAAVEIQPVSLTFVDEQGKPVHYTLKPNNASIPDGAVKPVDEIIQGNDAGVSDEKDQAPSRRSRSLHIFSRNAGRSRSPFQKTFKRREHGVSLCGGGAQDFMGMDENLQLFKDSRNYMNYVGNLLPESYYDASNYPGNSAYVYNAAGNSAMGY